MVKSETDERLVIVSGTILSQSIEMTGTTKRRTAGWVKRADRLPVHLTGLLHLSDGRKIGVVVTDMSAQGCKVSAHHLLPIGAIVQLLMPGQDLMPASIRWSMLGKAGLFFL